MFFCRELDEYKEKQDDNQNGGDPAKISSKTVSLPSVLDISHCYSFNERI